MHKDVAFCFENRQQELIGSIFFAYLQFCFDSILNLDLLPFLGEAITLEDETGGKPIRQFNFKIVNVLAFGVYSIFKSYYVL